MQVSHDRIVARRRAWDPLSAARGDGALRRHPRRIAVGDRAHCRERDDQSRPPPRRTRWQVEAPGVGATWPARRCTRSAPGRYGSRLDELIQGSRYGLAQLPDPRHAPVLDLEPWLCRRRHVAIEGGHGNPIDALRHAYGGQSPLVDLLHHRGGAHAEQVGDLAWRVEAVHVIRSCAGAMDKAQDNQREDDCRSDRPIRIDEG